MCRSVNELVSWSVYHSHLCPVLCLSPSVSLFTPSALVLRAILPHSVLVGSPVCCWRLLSGLCLSVPFPPSSCLPRVNGSVFFPLAELCSPVFCLSCSAFQFCPFLLLNKGQNFDSWVLRAAFVSCLHPFMTKIRLCSLWVTQNTHQFLQCDRIVNYKPSVYHMIVCLLMMSLYTRALY